MLQFLTAGESQGKSLSIIIEGLPAESHYGRRILIVTEAKAGSYGRADGWKLRRIKRHHCRIALGQNAGFSSLSGYP
jgi:chorismate synthase